RPCLRPHHGGSSRTSRGLERPCSTELGSGRSSTIVAPTGTTKDVAKLVAPGGRLEDVASELDPRVRDDEERVIRADGLADPVRRLGDLFLECAEQPIPNDEDASVVAIEIDRLGAVVHAM